MRGPGLPKPQPVPPTGWRQPQVQPTTERASAPTTSDRRTSEQNVDASSREIRRAAATGFGDQRRPSLSRLGSSRGAEARSCMASVVPSSIDPFAFRGQATTVKVSRYRGRCRPAGFMAARIVNEPDENRTECPIRRADANAERPICASLFSVGRPLRGCPPRPTRLSRRTPSRPARDRSPYQLSQHGRQSPTSQSPVPLVR
jgi:hypothetical protein